MQRSVRIVLAGLAGAATIVGSAGPLAARSARRGFSYNVDVQLKRLGVSLDPGPSNRDGNDIVAAEGPLLRGTRKLGTLRIDCQITGLPEGFLPCNGKATFTSGPRLGVVLFKGPSGGDGKFTTFTIVGGTRSFSGANGTFFMRDDPLAAATASRTYEYVAVPDAPIEPVSFVVR